MISIVDQVSIDRSDLRLGIDGGEVTE